MNKALRIFVVEDDGVTLMHLQDLLEDAGHVVVGTAMSAEEAISGVGETLPELLLLDMQLKEGSSGLEVARAVRHVDDLAVVFVTANARSVEEGFEGAVAVISKPFTETALTGSIAYLEECVHRPPPLLALPLCMRLAPGYLSGLG